MTINEIKQSLDRFNKTDILVFDACLMQTLEVSFELKENAEFILGSTQIQNFQGLPYEEVLNLMSENALPFEVAAELPRMSQESISGLHSDKFTMSSLNSTEMELIFLPEFEKVLEDLMTEMKRDPFLKLDLLMHLQVTQSFLGESRDLNSFLSYLEEFFRDKENIEFANKVSQLRQDLNRMLVSYVYGDHYVLARDYHLGAFKAFGIWLPLDLFDYEQRLNDFGESRFFNEFNVWKDFLAELHSNEL